MDQRSDAIGLGAKSRDAAPSAAADPGDLPLPFLTLLVAGVVGSVLWVWRGAGVAKTLGDTDDALRLVLVRDLASGRTGWWDQHLIRLQPPVGMDLHWSRLVDGGIVAVQSGLGLFLDPAHAELAVRTAWPFLWLIPVIAAALSIAKSLRGPAAVFLCALLAMVDLPAYAQWAPGRIDHHDVQISLCLVALAGVVRGGQGGYAAAGVATGLGLAVGVEALIFDALIGAAVALRFLFDPLRQRGPVRAYATGLLTTVVAAFLIQTPPTRWGVPVCDALGVNLVAGLAAASLGLLALAAFAAERPLAQRVAGLAMVGVAAGAVYAGLLPACLRGPLGQADPRLWPVWLSYIAEMQPLFKGLPDPKNSFGLSQALFHAAAVAAWLWLGRKGEGRTFAWGLAGACLAAGIAAEAAAVRMSFYASWFATPVLAAGVADAGAARLRRRRLLITALVVVAASPTWSSMAAAAVNDRLHPAKAKEPSIEGCSAPKNLAALGRLPAGLVLSEVDLGPNVLATTPHSVLAAPYHRMGWGILSADAALAAPPGADEAQVRRLHVTYVVNCKSEPSPWRKTLGPQSLATRLDRGRAPAWLEPLSRPADPLQIYRVRPNALG